MSSTRHHNVYEDCAACFWTSSVINFIPVLCDEAAAQCLLRLWEQYRRVYEVGLLGYVIMPNHFHVATWSEKAENSQRFLRRTLSLSSAEIGAIVRRQAEERNARSKTWMRMFQAHAGSGSGIAIWKERGRAFPVTDIGTMQQKLDYMHANPVRMGLVDSPEDWKNSSASWYLDETGPLCMDPVPW